MAQKLNITDRELEVLLLGADGMTDKEIAIRLGISRATISTHWSRMRSKLDALNRGQVIAKALAIMYRERQQALDDHNEFFRRLIDTLEEFAVFMIDADLTVLTWNPGVERILGYGEEEWLGGSVDRIFSEADRAKGGARLEIETAEREGRASDKKWHLKKDGQQFWSSGVMGKIPGPPDAPLRYCKVLEDLTRLKRLEERVRALGGDPDRV